MVIYLVLTCFKIFLARIIDVSMGTIRTILLSKDKVILPFIISFFEVIIWFLVAKEALLIVGNTFLVAIFYAAGYSTGTLIGSLISKYFNKSIIKIEVISSNNLDNILYLEYSSIYKILLYNKDILYIIYIPSKYKKGLITKLKEYKNTIIFLNNKII